MHKQVGVSPCTVSSDWTLSGCEGTNPTGKRNVNTQLSIYANISRRNNRVQQGLSTGMSGERTGPSVHDRSVGIRKTLSQDLESS